MTDLATRYADWKAPQTDGGLLLWPDAPALIDHARENNARLAVSPAAIQNTPLSELRADLRLFLGVSDPKQLVFATGHQTELHHPGVWAKNVLIDVAAKSAGGTAMHFAVDTDAPKHLVLKFPGYAEPFTDDANAAGADWSQLVNPPTPVQIRKLASDAESASADWPFEPMLGGYFSILRRLSLEAETLPGVLASSLHELDWGLGLRYSALLASPIWQSRPFAALVHHAMANAGRFAADYNAALKAYRTRHQIRTPGRPMPDLAVKDERCETPFWRDDISRGRRVRAWAERVGDRWTLAAGDDRFEFDPSLPAFDAADRLLAWLRKHNLRLAPRALTLTMSLRLLVADQFVHGIGGGQYDQVTDDLIHRHFGLVPPTFSVTTATLYFPLAAGRKRTSIPELLQAGHRLKHGLLGAEKAPILSAIAAAPRRSAERQAPFHDLHRRLDSAAKASPALAAWDVSLRDASAKQIEERALFDRELFYAIQPRERLEDLIAAYAGRFE